MSTLQLQKIEKTLLALSLEDLQNFIAELMSKAQTKNKIPERDATPEEARLIQESLDSGLASAEEVEEMENFLQIKLR